jgi:hypothetical protein
MEHAEEVGKMGTLRLEEKRTPALGAELEAEALSTLQPGHPEAGGRQVDRPARWPNLDAQAGRQVCGQTRERDVRGASKEPPRGEARSEHGLAHRGAKPSGAFEGEVAHDEGEPRTQMHRAHLRREAASGRLSLDPAPGRALDCGSHREKRHRDCDGHGQRDGDPAPGSASQRLEPFRQKT